MALDDKTLKKMSPAQLDTLEKIINEATRQGVNPDLAVALAEAETGGAFSHMRGDKVLKSPAGATGLMQIMPDTAKLFSKKFGFEINPEDEDSNIKGGVAILKDLLDQTKKPRNAVALYNASPKAVAKFIKTYETDPDAALMSLPEETQNYLGRVAGNFNLDDEKETGLITPQDSAAAPAAPADPFAGITSEAAKMKREEDERKKSAPPETPAVDEAAKEAERQIQGAVAGAAVNAVLPAVTNPEMPEKVDISRIQERANEKADALELARRNFREQVGEFRPFDEIQRQHLANQQELERIKIAEREAQARLRGLPRTPEATTVEAPVAAEAPKGKGSGAVNWIHSMADEVPEVIANQATNMRADNPRGGQAIIDKDTLAREKQSALGASDWGLARTEGGTQFVLPPELVSERAAQEAQAASEQQAELERRAEETRQQQDAARVRAELERRIHEAELQELRNQRVQAGTAFNQSKAEVRTAAPLQRSLTTAQTANELAQQKLARARTQPTSPLTRALEVRGVQSGTGSPVARTVVGGLTGYYGVMSLQEAMARAKAGDTSDEVIAALKAGAAATSLVPPAGKGLTRLRGAGSFGVGAGLAHELYKALSKNPDQPVQ